MSQDIFSLSPYNKLKTFYELCLENIDIKNVTSRILIDYSEILKKLMQDEELWESVRHHRFPIKSIRLRHQMCGNMLKGIIQVHKKHVKTFMEFFKKSYVKAFSYPCSDDLNKIIFMEKLALGFNINDIISPLSKSPPAISAPELPVVSVSKQHLISTREQLEPIEIPNTEIVQPTSSNQDVNCIEVVDEEAIAATEFRRLQIVTTKSVEKEDSAAVSTLEQVQQFLRESGLGMEGYENITTTEELQQILEGELFDNIHPLASHPKPNQSVSNLSSPILPPIHLQVQAEVHASAEIDFPQSTQRSSNLEPIAGPPDSQVPMEAHTLDQIDLPQPIQSVNLSSPILSPVHLQVQAEVHAPGQIDFPQSIQFSSNLLEPTSAPPDSRAPMEIHALDQINLTQPIQSVSNLSSPILPSVPLQVQAEVHAHAQIAYSQPTQHVKNLSSPILAPINGQAPTEDHIATSVDVVDLTKGEIDASHLKQSLPAQHFHLDDFQQSSELIRTNQVSAPITLTQVPGENSKTKSSQQVVPIEGSPKIRVRDMIKDMFSQTPVRRTTRRKSVRRFFYGDRALKNRFNKRLKPSNFISHEHERLEELNAIHRYVKFMGPNIEDLVSDTNHEITYLDWVEVSNENLPSFDSYTNSFCAVFNQFCEDVENKRGNLSRWSEGIIRSSIRSKLTSIHLKITDEQPQLQLTKSLEPNIEPQMFVHPSIVREQLDEHVTQMTTLPHEEIITVSGIPQEQEKKQKQSEEEEKEPIRRKHISSEHVLKKLENLRGESAECITFETLCPANCTDRFCAASMFGRLLSMHGKKTIFLEQDVGEMSPSSLRIYLL